MAATIKLIRTAYLRFLVRNSVVRTPILVRNIMTIGSSKIKPNASINFMTKSRYEPIDIMGVRLDVLYVNRNSSAYLRTTK